MMADPLCQADPLPCATAQLGKLNGHRAYRLILPVPLSVGGKARIAGGGYGVQYLVSVAGYSEAMSDGGQGAGGDVQVWPFNTSNNQKWNIWWGGTAWMLTNIGNGLCANDQYGSAANGTLVNMWSCNTGDSRQWWYPEPVDICNPIYATCVVFTITPSSNKYGSSIQSPGATNSGGNVSIHSRNDGNYNQLWANECHNSSGWYICFFLIAPFGWGSVRKRLREKGSAS
jgi:hypothetical protein